MFGIMLKKCFMSIVELQNYVKGILFVDMQLWVLVVSTIACNGVLEPSLCL